MQRVHFQVRVGVQLSRQTFTITAEIHARSLANFYGQYVERHMNLKFMRRVGASARNSTIYYRKNQIDVSFY